MAPSMASRTVAHGRGMPNFRDNAAATPTAVVSPPDHASGTAAGSTSVDGMGGGGALTP
jgi:hypothetical protein